MKQRGKMAVDQPHYVDPLEEEEETPQKEDQEYGKEEKKEESWSSIAAPGAVPP